MSWIAYFYFEGLVFFFLNILVFLVINISLGILPIITALGGSVPGRIVPLLKSGVDDRLVSFNITNVYYFNFLIGIIFNKITLLFVF